MCGSGKIRYETPVDAMLAIQRIQHQRNLEETEKYEKTYYDCWVCGGYHVTSWETELG